MSQRFNVTISGVDTKTLGSVLAAIPDVEVTVAEVTETWGSARLAVLRNVMSHKGEPQVRSHILAWAVMFGGFVGPIADIEAAFDGLVKDGEIVANDDGTYAPKGHAAVVIDGVGVSSAGST